LPTKTPLRLTGAAAVLDFGFRSGLFEAEAVARDAAGSDGGSFFLVVDLFEWMIDIAQSSWGRSAVGQLKLEWRGPVSGVRHDEEARRAGVAAAACGLRRVDGGVGERIAGRVSGAAFLDSNRPLARDRRSRMPLPMSCSTSANTSLVARPRSLLIGAMVRRLERHLRPIKRPHPTSANLARLHRLAPPRPAPHRRAALVAGRRPRRKRRLTWPPASGYRQVHTTVQRQPVDSVFGLCRS
jgi:hypothetical protein